MVTGDFCMKKKSTSFLSLFCLKINHHGENYTNHFDCIPYLYDHQCLYVHLQPKKDF